jgi:hypothetical protein
MRGAIPPFPHYVLMAWCLVKQRDNFTPFTYRKRQFRRNRETDFLASNWIRLLRLITYGKLEGVS